MSREGGGIAIYYKEYLEVENINVEFDSAEVLCLRINSRGESVVVVASYRPPNQNVNHFNDELDSFLSIDQVKNEKNVVLLGDINICYLTNMYGSDNYINTLYSNGFYNTIKKPTRVEFYNNVLVSTCLDHVNIRTHNNVYRSFLIESKIADHYWTGVKLELSKAVGLNLKNECKYKDIILTRKVNESIQNENWWPILDLRDPSEIYIEIINRFKRIYNNCSIRRKLGTKESQNPWFNFGIQRLIDRKNYFWGLLKRDKYNLALRDAFKKARNELTAKIRLEKKNYYFRVLSDNFKDSKKNWEVINQFINKKQRPTILESIKSSFRLKEDEEIAGLTEEFKTSFKETIEGVNSEMTGQTFDLSQNFTEGNFSIGNIISMNLITIDEHLLYVALSKLNHKSSPGPDNIRPQDLKNNIFHLKLVLIHLIKRIVKTGTIPHLMKVTYLRPIFKSGSKNNLSCYRPVGSVSVITKILEHYICMQLQSYLTKWEIISNAQYGFIPQKSTVDLLERLTSDVNRALNENKFVIAVATDLTKAFDLVCYRLMLDKLTKIGIGGQLFKLFEDYFTGRTLHVSIGNYVSSSYSQTCGLVQGSILSPTLFNIYVNDLASLKFNCKMLQYADDNIFYMVHTDLSIGLRCVQQDLDLAVKYFFNNSIKLNSQKTKAIVFKNPRVNVNRNIDISLLCHQTNCLRKGRMDVCACQMLVFVDTIKHLGVHLDADMKFNTHVASISKILRVMLLKCYRISCYFPVITKRIIYFSMIQSIVYYGITLYYLSPDYVKKPLCNLLSRIIKVLFNHIPQNMLGIMSLDALGKYTDLSRNYFKLEFREINDIDYNLRQRQFRPQRTYNNYGKLVPEYKIPSLLNSLPIALRTLQSKNEVKTRLKSYFITYS